MKSSTGTTTSDAALRSKVQPAMTLAFEHAADGEGEGRMDSAGTTNLDGALQLASAPVVAITSAVAQMSIARSRLRGAEITASGYGDGKDQCHSQRGISPRAARRRLEEL